MSVISVSNCSIKSKRHLCIYNNLVNTFATFFVYLSSRFRGGGGGGTVTYIPFFKENCIGWLVMHIFGGCSNNAGLE